MKFYRSFKWKGEEREECFEADNELDAESDSYYFEQDITRGDSSDSFEWTSGIYDFETKIKTQQIAEARTTPSKG